ncbi:MAG TPA: hypothetical protein VF949_02070, partial [Reyranella sp.]
MFGVGVGRSAVRSAADIPGDFDAKILSRHPDPKSGDILATLFRDGSCRKRLPLRRRHVGALDFGRIADCAAARGAAD